MKTSISALARSQGGGAIGLSSSDCHDPMDTEIRLPRHHLTLKRVGHAIVCPILLSLAGLCSTELILRPLAPQSMVSQLIVVALGFAVVFSVSALIPSVRKEVMPFRELWCELRFSRQFVEPAGQTPHFCLSKEKRLW
jgi:hypothetical protein